MKNKGTSKASLAKKISEDVLAKDTSQAALVKGTFKAALAKGSFKAALGMWTSKDDQPRDLPRLSLPGGNFQACLNHFKLGDIV